MVLEPEAVAMLFRFTEVVEQVILAAAVQLMDGLLLLTFTVLDVVVVQPLPSCVIVTL